MTIVKPSNCGNAPKNKFIEDFISTVLSNEVYEYNTPRKLDQKIIANKIE